MKPGEKYYVDNKPVIVKEIKDDYFTYYYLDGFDLLQGKHKITGGSGLDFNDFVIVRDVAGIDDQVRHVEISRRDMEHRSTSQIIKDRYFYETEEHIKKYVDSITYYEIVPQYVLHEGDEITGGTKFCHNGAGDNCVTVAIPFKENEKNKIVNYLKPRIEIAKKPFQIINKTINLATDKILSTSYDDFIVSAKEIKKNIYDKLIMPENGKNKFISDLNITCDDIGDHEPLYINITRKGITPQDKIFYMSDTYYDVGDGNEKSPYDGKKLDSMKLSDDPDSNLFLLSQEYFICLQPRNEAFYFILFKLILAWYTDDKLSIYVTKIRILVNYFRGMYETTDQIKVNSKLGVKPVITLVLRYGVRAFSVVIEKISMYFAHYIHLGMSIENFPCYYIPLNDLIFYSNGDPDVKKKIDQREDSLKYYNKDLPKKRGAFKDAKIPISYVGLTFDEVNPGNKNTTGDKFFKTKENKELNNYKVSRN